MHFRYNLVIQVDTLVRELDSAIHDIDAIVRDIDAALAALPSALRPAGPTDVTTGVSATTSVGPQSAASAASASFPAASAMDVDS